MGFSFSFNLTANSSCCQSFRTNQDERNIRGLPINLNHINLNSCFCCPYHLLATSINLYNIFQFPDLLGHIYGEESNEFSCLDGQMLCLSVGNTEEDTCKQLVRILGDQRAAESLSQLVHSTASVGLDIPDCDLSTENLGIWIDPIGKV